MSYNGFIIKSLAFVVLIFLADRCTGLALKWLYDNQKDEEYFYASEAMERQEAKLVVLGSSRARNHYDPKILEDSLGLSCFNAGRSGYFLMYQSAQLHVMLSRYTPEHIILDIVPYDFTGGNNYDRMSVLLPYKDHEEVHRFLKMRSDFEMWKCISDIYPYNSMFLKLISNLKDRGVFHKNGFQPLYGHHNGEKSVYDNDSIPTDADKIEEFNAIIKLCKSKGIGLTVVTSPFYADYRKQTSTTKLVKEICNDEGIVYLNFLNDSDFDDIKLFHTADHLNTEGVDLFSKKIASVLSRIMKGTK